MNLPTLGSKSPGPVCSSLVRRMCRRRADKGAPVCMSPTRRNRPLLLRRSGALLRRPPRTSCRLGSTLIMTVLVLRTSPSRKLCTARSSLRFRRVQSVHPTTYIVLELRKGEVHVQSPSTLALSPDHLTTLSGRVRCPFSPPPRGRGRRLSPVPRAPPDPSRRARA